MPRICVGGCGVLWVYAKDMCRRILKSGIAGPFGRFVFSVLRILILISRVVATFCNPTNNE